MDVRVSERPSLVFSWELKVRNDTEPTDSSPSPGSAAATMRRIDLDLEAPDDDVISVRRSAVDDGDRAAQCRNLGESRDVAPVVHGRHEIAKQRASLRPTARPAGVVEGLRVELLQVRLDRVPYSSRCCVLVAVAVQLYQ